MTARALRRALREKIALLGEDGPRAEVVIATAQGMARVIEAVVDTAGRIQLDAQLPDGTLLTVRPRTR